MRAKPIKSVFFCTLLLLGYQLSISVSLAFSWSPKEIIQEPVDFILGCAGSIALHEASHWIVASSLGYKPEWDNVSIVYSGNGPMPDDDRIRIASAGILAQWLASEAAFSWGRNGTDEHDVGTFSAGIIAGEILTTAAYLTFLKAHEEGDIHGIHEAIGLSHDQIAGLIAIPAVLDSWRLLDSQPPKWLPVAAKIYKGSGVVFVWTF